jgi:glycine oxidase
MSEKPQHVVIVGGGVIGCSVAYYLARHGVRSLVLESGRLGALASDAAAGVLLVRTEDERMRRLAMESFAMFPDLVEQLIDVSGIVPMYERLARIDVALDEADAAELRGWLAHPALDGFEHEWLDGDAVRSVEPLLRPGCIGGLHVPGSAAISGWSANTRVCTGCRVARCRGAPGRR